MHRRQEDYADPRPAVGAKAITAALNSRRDSMRIGIDALRAKLDGQVSQIVAHFNPGKASRDMLATLDIFRLQRVINGHPGLRDDFERGGARGLLSSLRGRLRWPRPVTARCRPARRN